MIKYDYTVNAGGIAMRRIKEDIRNLSIGKKIIFYTYIVIIPILVLICIAVTGYRYYINQQEYLVQQKAGMNNLALSLNNNFSESQ